jgi:YhhN-like protein.
MNPIQLFLFYVNKVIGNDPEVTRQKTIRSYLVLKMTLSLGALLTAFVELAWYSDFKDCMFIIPGLIFCTFGDIALYRSNEYDIEMREPHFTLGVMSFGFAHILFCSDLIYLAGFKFTPAIGMSLVTFAMIYFFSKKGILVLNGYKKILYAYALLVGAFCGCGINLMIVSPVLDRQVLMLGIGSIVFWFSDLSLSFRCFNKRVPDWFGTFVFTSYFIAAYMIAVSLRGF